MIYLGVDISKATFDASLLVNGKHKNKCFQNANKGFEELTVWLTKAGSGEQVHVCMEGTGKLWESLAEFLYDKGFHVSVVNPVRVKGYGKSELRRSKTDVLDAELIARFCRAQNPTAWKPRAPEMKAVRDRQRYISELKESRTQEKNRLQAGRIDTAIEKRILMHIEYINREIEAIKQEIQEMVKADEKLLDEVQLLQSIVGVGETTAVTFLAELPAMENFPNARALETFCGITPRRFESGTSVRGRNRISKIGNPRIRSALYLPAVAAIRANPVMREFAERLKAAGKPAKVIICAVIRKLIRLMFAILKSGKPFDVAHVSIPVPAQQMVAIT